MKTPSTPVLARYFAKVRLTVHSAASFTPDGVSHTSWALSHAENGKPYWMGERKLFASTSELWSAWKAHQLSLHLQYAQALRLVRFYLRNEPDHVEPFNAWLDYKATARAAQFDEVDVDCWPWTSATTSMDRRDRLSTPGWPWSDAPTPAVIRRCSQRSAGHGWARRAVRVADFDRQSATRYIAAVRDLVQQERRRMFDRKTRKIGLSPARPARRI